MNRADGLHEPPSADPASAVAFQLGPFRLGGSPAVLLLDGQPVALGARGAAVLRVLVSAAPEFVAKDRIVDAAWPGLVVEESNLSVQISAVRRALATVPGAEDWLQTLPRRGYRYVGPRAACADDGPAAQGAGSPTAAAAPAAAVAPTNLTEPITSFIGRRVEVAETNQRLDESRLLTLLGAGGVGKTRLAPHVSPANAMNSKPTWHGPARCWSMTPPTTITGSGCSTWARPSWWHLRWPASRLRPEEPPVTTTPRSIMPTAVGAHAVGAHRIGAGGRMRRSSTGCRVRRQVTGIDHGA